MYCVCFNLYYGSFNMNCEVVLTCTMVVLMPPAVVLTSIMVVLNCNVVV